MQCRRQRGLVPMHYHRKAGLPSKEFVLVFSFLINFLYLFSVILPSWDFYQLYHSAFRRKQQVMAWRKPVWQAFLKLFSTFSVFLSSLLGSLFCIPPSFPRRNSYLSIRLNTKSVGCSLVTRPTAEALALPIVVERATQKPTPICNSQFCTTKVQKGISKHTHWGHLLLPSLDYNLKFARFQLSKDKAYVNAIYW